MNHFSPEDVAIFSFSGIYEQEGFWREPRKAAPAFSFFDFSDLPGTNGYLSEDARAIIERAIDRLSSRNTAPLHPGLHFIDSGNTHYMTKLLTDRIREPFALMLFDHHPDMQRPAFGGLLSCGSWLRASLEENSFLRKAWLIGVDEALAREAGYDDTGKPVLLVPPGAPLPISELPLYLSIDKDVLSENEVRTNWDQGTMPSQTLLSMLRFLRDDTRLLGVDICGECAVHPADAPLAPPLALQQNDNFNTKILDIFLNAR